MDEDFDLDDPLIESQPSESIPYILFASESQQTPSQSYFVALKTSKPNASLRRDVLASIFLRQSHLSFDPFVAYLAVNYLDRFLSLQGLPSKGEPWVVKLLSISCLCLALKMNKIAFSLADIQGEEGFILDAVKTRRMELLILSALKWRMRSITPFAFLGFFLSLFNRNDPPLKEAIKARATDVIFKAQNEIKMLVYKPSIIAASALLSASHELSPLHFPFFRTAISSSVYVNKEKLLDCCNLMLDILMNGYESILLGGDVSSAETPVNVLDCHCLSSESEKTSNSTSIKRRRTGDFNSFPQISQIQRC